MWSHIRNGNVDVQIRSKVNVTAKKKVKVFILCPSFTTPLYLGKLFLVKSQ